MAAGDRAPGPTIQRGRMMTVLFISAALFSVFAVQLVVGALIVAHEINCDDGVGMEPPDRARP